MPQQLCLIEVPRGTYHEEHGSTDYDDLAPFRNAYFPAEYRLGLEALFRAEGHLAATGRLKSDTPCPYRAGGIEFYALPLLGPQRLLFDENQRVPLALTCDCPKSHMLVNDLGQRQPKCSKHRCPVRAIVVQAA
jgi:hypothetical protein